MAYLCELGTGQRIYLDNAGLQTIVTTMSGTPGQQQQASNGFQTGAWVSTPQIYQTPQGAVLKVIAEQGEFFIHVQGGSMNVMSGAPGLGNAQQMQVQSVPTMPNSSMPSMQPMQLMQPMQMNSPAPMNSPAASSQASSSQASSSFPNQQAASQASAQSQSPSQVPEMQPMQPIQPMQPMHLNMGGGMQMGMNPMEMKMGNMEMRMNTPSPSATNSSTKRFCSQCGASVSSSDRFCASCGHQLNA